MDNRKSIAIILAMFSAILVMLAGKACTSGSKKQNNTKKNNALTTQNFTVDIGVQEGTPAGTGSIQEYTLTEKTSIEVEYVTDVLGRVLEIIPHTSEPDVEYVTDMLGRVVSVIEHEKVTTTEPQVEYVTDMLGRVISVIEPETTETTQDPTAVTTTKNILEEYNEKHPLSTMPTVENDIEDSGYIPPSSIHITIG